MCIQPLKTALVLNKCISAHTSLFLVQLRKVLPFSPNRDDSLKSTTFAGRLKSFLPYFVVPDRILPVACSDFLTVSLTIFGVVLAPTLKAPVRDPTF